MSDFLAEHRASRLTFFRLTRLPIVALLGWFSLSLIVLRNDWIFLDGVNLLLHEAGHFFFSWAPQSLYILGGTLGQLAWPAIFFGYFWFKRRDPFAATAMVWWFGENLLNVARYLGDAVLEHLPITGEIHDWAFLARRFNFLASVDTISLAIRVGGIILMVGSLAYLTKTSLFPPKDMIDNALDAE
jgi:hypothetical protein